MILAGNCRRSSAAGRGTLVLGRKHVNKAGRSGLGSGTERGGSGWRIHGRRRSEERGKEVRRKLGAIRVTGSDKKDERARTGARAKKNLGALLGGKTAPATRSLATSTRRINAAFYETAASRRKAPARRIFRRTGNFRRAFSTLCCRYNEIKLPRDERDPCLLAFTRFKPERKRRVCDKTCRGREREERTRGTRLKRS